MSEWRRGTIGELARGHRGVSYAAGQLRQLKSTDTVTLLRSNNIKRGRLNFEDIQIVPARIVADEQVLRSNDIAVCMSNGSRALVGKAAPFVGYNSEVFTVGAFCSIFRPNEKSKSSFVNYVFQSKEYRKNLDLALAGTAINNLKNSDIEAFGCDIPPPEDQAKIAEILDTLDTAIHETEAIIAKLKAVKQGLLHDLLTRGIDANGELRPAQFEAPHLYKESPLGWIPKEWHSEGLEELVATDSPITYGVVQPGPEIEGGVPFIRGGDIYGGRILTEQLRTISQRISNGYRRTQLRGGEILMSLVGYPGEVGIVPIDLIGANIARQAALIRLADQALASYVMHYLSSEGGKRQILGQSLGSAQQVVNLGDLRTVKVPLPPPDESADVARRVGAANQRIDEEIGVLSKLRELKVGLMDDLLPGCIRVTPLLAEAVQQPASA